MDLALPYLDADVAQGVDPAELEANARHVELQGAALEVASVETVPVSAQPLLLTSPLEPQATLPFHYVKASLFQIEEETRGRTRVRPLVHSEPQLPSPNSSQVPLIGFCFTPRREKSQTPWAKISFMRACWSALKGTA